MEFAEILAQVIDLLAREKRLAYRALKLRFHLDDAYLDGIKEDMGSVALVRGEAGMRMSRPAQVLKDLLDVSRHDQTRGYRRERRWCPLNVGVLLEGRT